MNKILIAGNIGADAELKILTNGTAVLKFALATTEKWKDKEGNKQEKTEWHRVSLFGPRATNLAQYLTKGTKVIVEGSMTYGSYEKDNIKFYTADVKAQNIEFVGGGKPRSDDSGEELSVPTGDNEIPF